MKSRRIDDKYRILKDGDHLLQEISQEELDKILSDFIASVDHIRSSALSISKRHDIPSDVVSEIMYTACMDHVHCVVSSPSKLSVTDIVR